MSASNSFGEAAGRNEVAEVNSQLLVSIGTVALNRSFSSCISGSFCVNCWTHRSSVPRWIWQRNSPRAANDGDCGDDRIPAAEWVQLRGWNDVILKLSYTISSGASHAATRVV